MRFLRALLPLWALVFFVGACTSANNVSLEDPAPLDADFAPPDKLPFEDIEMADDALRLAMVKPATIDPAKVSLVDQNAVIVSDLIYDGLVEAGGTEGYLRPALATSWGHGGNFSTWSFTLDTTRATPEMVKQSFERLVRTAPTQPAVLMLDNVFGSEEVRTGTADTISGITVVSDDTVEIRLGKPDAGFPWLLTGLNYSIVGLNAEPTGSYAVTADDGSSLQLSAGDSEVAITFVGTAAEAGQLLTDGVVDAAVTDAATDETRAITKFFALNTLAPDLVDVNKRRAVLAAVGADTAVEVGSDLIAVGGAAAPASGGFETDACADACALDSGAVLENLNAEAPPFMTIAYVGDKDAPLAEAISNKLANAGFGTEVVQYEALDLAQAITNGEAEIFSFGWAAPGHSIDSVISPVFSSHSQLNVARLASQDVDELLAAASGVGDDTLRWALLQQAHAAALDTAVMIPIGAAPNMLVTSADMEPLNIKADGSIDLTPGG